MSHPATDVWRKESAGSESACAGRESHALLRGDGVNYLRPGPETRASERRPDVSHHHTTRPQTYGASLAISAGANIKVLQRMLGHASAVMTLDRYADLFEDDLDTVAGALHTARQDQLWHRDATALDT